jgi:hypothetical protein
MGFQQSSGSWKISHEIIGKGRRLPGRTQLGTFVFFFFWLSAQGQFGHP